MARDGLSVCDGQVLVTAAPHTLVSGVYDARGQVGERPSEAFGRSLDLQPINPFGIDPVRRRFLGISS